MRPSGDVLYRKVGRRYVPVANTELVFPYHNGFYLVHVDDGVSSRYSTVEPDNAAMLAAMKLAERDLCDLVLDASRLRPQTGLSEKEKQAVKAMRDVLGADGFPSFIGPSASEIAERVIAKVVERAQTTKETP